MRPVRLILLLGMLVILGIPAASWSVSPAETFAEYRTLCEQADIELPTRLPNQLTCKNVGDYRIEIRECNGWRVIGAPKFEDLAARPRVARIYEWHNDHTPTTRCFYLYRTNDPPKFAHQVLCFNQSNCDVCAFDHPGTADSHHRRTIEWKELIPANSGDIQNCSACHAAGTLAPLRVFKNRVVNQKTEMLKINKLCAAQGGPRWIGGSPKYFERQNKLFFPPGQNRQVDPPVYCGGGGCHANGFARTDSFCQDGEFKRPCDPLRPSCGNKRCVNQFCESVVAPAFARGLILKDDNGRKLGTTPEGSMFLQRHRTEQLKQFRLEMGCE